ncbi:hypothetical protein DL764_008131 [Monosporascus ibericus]|uniref:NAD(P)-binding protein n=1 Tax=Monosporascus ibericus TaxID=155417 RepID=A0A4Q4SY94_9PEZI|nr:hypothetical protein DL764_008131 [Monosporascus ibericus]
MAILLPSDPSVKLVAPAGAAVILPLRLIFPRPKPPKGLVLITGASSGIGAELSYIFAGKGHDLVLIGRDPGQLEAVANNIKEKYGKTAQTTQWDLSVPGAAKSLYDEVTKRGLQVDVLINCAGLGAAGETLEQPIDLVEKMTTLNCIALVQLTQLFGTDMAKRGQGWILQVSSVGESLSVELRGYPGVVNTQLMPGPTHTQFITRSHAEETFMMTSGGAVEDPKAVAVAGYKGLCKGKRMVFGSWNSAFNALFMYLAPRSVHLTLASLMNAPLRGASRTEEPLEDQNIRGETLGKE